MDSQISFDPLMVAALRIFLDFPFLYFTEIGIFIVITIFEFLIFSISSLIFYYETRPILLKYILGLTMKLPSCAFVYVLVKCLVD